nr:unnamed protein product [Callosobruchus chinensis]
MWIDYQFLTMPVLQLSPVQHFHQSNIWRRIYEKGLSNKLLNTVLTTAFISPTFKAGNSIPLEATSLNMFPLKRRFPRPIYLIRDEGDLFKILWKAECFTNRVIPCFDQKKSSVIIVRLCPKIQKKSELFYKLLAKQLYEPLLRERSENTHISRELESGIFRVVNITSKTPIKRFYLEVRENTAPFVTQN